MIALVEKNIESIRELCKKHFVRRFDLVGSAVNRRNFRDDSDVDFLYSFKKSEIPEANYADNYFELLFALESLLNRRVDLVAEEKIRNPFFLKSINDNRIPLYEA